MPCLTHYDQRKDDLDVRTGNEAPRTEKWHYGLLKGEKRVVWTMEKKCCENCMWYEEFNGVCFNGNSSFRGGYIHEYGDPKKLICGHYEHREETKK